MPADGVLSADAGVAPAPGTHRCWIRPAGTGGDVTGAWFDVRDGERVLHEMIKRQVADIPVGCRGGGCGVCKVRVIEGDYSTKRMSRKHISSEDEAEGIVLACRLIPHSDLVVELASTTIEPATDSLVVDPEP